MTHAGQGLLVAEGIDLPAQIEMEVAYGAYVPDNYRWQFAQGVTPVRRGRVDVHLGAPTGRIPSRMSVSLPDGWTATTGGVTVAMRRTPVDPRVSQLGTMALRDTLDRGGDIAWAWAVRETRLVPEPWIFEWDGFAASLLPRWASLLRLDGPPRRRDDVERGAIGVSLSGGGIWAEALLVRRGRWTLGAAVTSGAPIDDLDRLRELATRLRIPVDQR